MKLDRLLTLQSCLCQKVLIVSKRQTTLPVLTLVPNPWTICSLTKKSHKEHRLEERVLSFQSDKVKSRNTKATSLEAIIMVPRWTKRVRIRISWSSKWTATKWNTQKARKKKVSNQASTTKMSQAQQISWERTTQKVRVPKTDMLFLIYSLI